MDRDEFAQRQAAMTSTWYEGVKARVQDVEAYIAGRQYAYLDRWKEAGRFIQPGARVLDIGGGNLYRELLDYFQKLGIDYYYVDVDPAAVDASKALAQSMGINPNHLNQGFNDKLNYEDSTFDCIFSSHCIEHSIDLASTFSEINRVLTSNGYLLMAVPFGWEENPEHPYFFTPELWISLLEDNGFEVRTAQIGREYPESGADFFVAAKKVGPITAKQRISPHDFRKANYSFYPHDAPSIHYTGNRTVSNDGKFSHLRGPDWSITINSPKNFHQILPVLIRHDWSAQIKISTSTNATYHDLFSWFHYIQPCIHENPSLIATPVTITATGKNICSRATEAALYGYMIR